MSCSVCESPHAADVDAALRRGSGHKALARRFGLDTAAVREHRRQCLSTSPPLAVGVPLGEPYAGPVCVCAPARERPDPRNAGDFDTRVAFVLSEMAAGDFDAPREVPLLAAAWGLSTDHTRRIVRAAGAAYRASTPDLDALRAASMGRWMHLYRAALAADDVRAAAVALVGHDKVSGAANGAKAPESPIAEHPEFLAAADMFVAATHGALDVDGLCAACPDVPRSHVAALVAAALAALDRHLSEVEAIGTSPPPAFPVPLADVFAAQDAMRANTEGAYARARDTGAHGEGAHGWT